MIMTKVLIGAASLIFTASIASAASLSCKTSIPKGEGEKVLDSQTVGIITDPMTMADLSLQPLYGYVLSAEVRADRVKIYAEGNGISLAAEGQNLAQLNMAKTNLTEVFAVNCVIK